MIWAEQPSTNAGGCLPRSNWATYRDGGENLERVRPLLKLLGQLDGDDVAK